MWDKVKTYMLAHIIGVAIIIAGWFFAIFNTALDKFSQKTIFNGYNITGLIIIIIGAYFPEIWIYLKKKRNNH